MSEKYKVAVKCYTYNQANYILDALNGFVIQQTQFPYVCCIVDDASTDGEQEVIRSYFSTHFDLEEVGVSYERETEDAFISYARHKTNTNCFFAVLYLKKNLFWDNKKKMSLLSEWIGRAEYIALCEGDDYWIDRNKLFKQVSFLDQNVSYGCVFTDYNVVDPKSRLISVGEMPALYKKMKQNVSDGHIFGKLFNSPSCIMTCTIMHRQEYWKDYAIDHDRIFDISSKSLIKYDTAVTSCYRINPNGLMRSEPECVNKLLFETTTKWMIKYYNGELGNIIYEDKSILKEVRLFVSKYTTAIIKGNKSATFSYLFCCIRKDMSLLLWIPFNICKRLVGKFYTKLNPSHFINLFSKNPL